MRVIKGNKIILTGKRNQTDGLWDVNLPDIANNTQSYQRPVANIIIRKGQTQANLATYLHAVLGSPPISSFLQAIRNGNLIGWPGINAIQPNHIIKTVATAKGHLEQTRKNLQTTKETPDPDTNPEKQEKTHSCFALITTHVNSKAYADITGRFPHKSSRGNQYLFVVYDFDSNAILVEPLKSRQAAEITKAWKAIHSKLETNATAPSLYILNNEASGQFKQALKKYKIDYQLAPPHMHCINAAERAICSFKNHFLAIMATADPAYPAAEWDRLLPQAELTINLLPNARANPKLSAYAYLFGQFDFNRNPLAPAGTKVLVHEKPTQRRTWAYHGIDGWYIGPAMEHYRCMRCYIPSLASVRVTDTIDFFPKLSSFPKMTNEEYLRKAIEDLITVVKARPHSLPNLQEGDPTKTALEEIANLLGRAMEPPVVTPEKKEVPKQMPAPHAPLDNTTPSAAAAAHVITYPHSTANNIIPVSRVEQSPIQSQRLPRVEPLQITPNKTKQNETISHNNRHPPTHMANHVYNAQTGKRETIDTLLQGNQQKIWQ